jgi:hypothetical protein
VAAVAGRPEKLNSTAGEGLSTMISRKIASFSEIFVLLIEIVGEYFHYFVGFRLFHA